MLNKKQTEFLNQALQVATEVKKDTGILISGQVAQAAIESAWGAKQPKFNCFGIKMHSCIYVSGVQIFWSHENGPNAFPEKFAAYKSLEDCFRCHALTLKHNFPHAYIAKNINDYTASLTLDSTTKLSYAPYNKNYANEIINIATIHNLLAFDIAPQSPSSGDKDEQA